MLVKISLLIKPKEIDNPKDALDHLLKWKVFPLLDNIEESI
jgi:hypothetical protein